MENRNHQGEQEEESSKPDRELCQNSGGLRSKEIVCKTSTEGCTKAFTLGALHKNGEDHQKADDHQERNEDRHEEPHRR